MERLQFNSVEVPLLEPPHKDNRTLRRILYVLFKNRRFIARAFLVVSLPVIIATLLKPAEYLASTKILIKPSRAFLNLSLSPTSDGRVSVEVSPEIINTEIQIIKSRELLKRLAKEVPFPGGDNGNSPQSTESDVDRNASRIARGLKATPIRNSNLVQISFVARDPEWAARVVNRAAELYMEQHVNVHKTRGVEEFYDEQEKKLVRELKETEITLEAYQEKEKIVDAGQELTSNLARLAAFETNLKNTESSILEAQGKITILERQLREQRENVSAGKSIADNPVYTKVNERIVQLQLERNNLLQRYTENDRLVMDKDKEIAELKNRLSAQVQKMVEGESVSLNSLHQGILDSLLKERAGLKALEGRRSSLLKQVATYSSMAAGLKKKSFEYDRLQQDVNAKKEALGLYKKKGEEARISDAMDERKFGNASIVEKAGLPLPRADWSLWMVILITLMGSIAVAVTAAFITEFLDTTLRNEADVEEQVGLPVLATIQYYKI